MRSVFSILGILAALLIVGLLVKKQLAPPAINPTSVVKPTPQQVQQQFKQALDAAVQTPRLEPDEK